MTARHTWGSLVSTRWLARGLAIWAVIVVGACQGVAPRPLPAPASDPDDLARAGLAVDSDLMITGLRCGPEARAARGAYLTRHGALVAVWEDRLIARARRDGVADPLRTLHTLRTRLANEAARRAAAVPRRDYCLDGLSRLEALARDGGDALIAAAQARAADDRLIAGLPLGAAGGVNLTAEPGPLPAEFFGLDIVCDPTAQPRCREVPAG